MGTNVHGKNLDAPELFPLYEKAVELGVPLFVHPEDVAASERLRRFFMLNLVGNPLDTAIAIACVTLGGVLERYPELKLVFAHGGGYAPYQRGRLEHGYRVKAEARQGAPRPPSDYFGLLHFDSLIHYGPALEYLVTTCGSDKVLLGSDYPFEMGDPDPVGSVRGLKGVSEEDRRRILGENAARLFRLD
ncbi:MAG: amidohydrolase family protein [Deltaproteobacteria bacterium]|nr:amidohydrolase family protein [Deltaproteobacteria bacterium]